MKVKDIMTSIKKTSSETRVAAAAKIMDEKNIGSLLVEVNGKIEGIVTERDLLKKVVAKCKDPCNTTVGFIMNVPLITIDPDKTLEEANQIMTEKKIRRLPVEEDGKIIGMITIRDISDNLKYSLGKSIREGNNYYRPSYGKDV